MRIGVLAAILFTGILANDKTRKIYENLFEKLANRVMQEIKDKEDLL